MFKLTTVTGLAESYLEISARMAMGVKFSR